MQSEVGSALFHDRRRNMDPLVNVTVQGTVETIPKKAKAIPFAREDICHHFLRFPRSDLHRLFREGPNTEQLDRFGVELHKNGSFWRRKKCSSIDMNDNARANTSADTMTTLYYFSFFCRLITYSNAFVCTK